MDEKILNAKIENVTITMQDHGVLTFWISFSGQCSGCLGGYCIGHGYVGADKFEGSAIGLEVMMRIMDVVGVENWEDLKGQYIRIVNPGLGGKYDKIGNIIKNKWISISDCFEKARRKDD